ncbi:hypothetical protein [Arthrobacter sp. CG_A4]|uniref:hypothetical protein n=1 Tax=Arthrobacter sp. CG_A4 TaxID=3071706 RepID=UPI002E0CBC57|nr:hypothetical protein [Arthrobacter sp. CG_A4]
MDIAPEPAFQDRLIQDQAFEDGAFEDGALEERSPGEGMAGVLKAMSPGAVDFLFRRLVAGESAEDVQWHREGLALSAQMPGAELARRLAEADLEALTPTELFHYVRATQRLSAWTESLRESAVGRYCAPPSDTAAPSASAAPTAAPSAGAAGAAGAAPAA